LVSGLDTTTRKRAGRHLAEDSGGQVC